MANELKGKRIAILAADGVEEIEYQSPREAVQNAGADVEMISLKPGEIQAMHHDIEPASKIRVDKVVAETSPDDYDGLVLPGGAVNPDKLRQDRDAIVFVQEFFKSGKPVGAICHAPVLLAEADLVRDRTLTSYASVRSDIRCRGGNVVDQEVVVDEGLVTSRGPDDLPAFCAKIIEEFAEGEHRVANAGATTSA